LKAFVRANVKRGATLVTDGHASYPGLTDYRHDPRVVGKMAAHVVLPWIHRVFALMKRWELGTYHGLRRKHVDTYLNELRLPLQSPLLPARLVRNDARLAAHHEPASYWDVIGAPIPARAISPLGASHGVEKTATGMRQDGSAAPKPSAIRI